MRFLAIPFLATLLMALPVSAQDPSFLFSASDETVDFNPDDGIATIAATLSISEVDGEVGSPSSTGGFQMALAHDADILDLIIADPAEDLAALNNGDGPGFFGPDYSPDNGDGLVLGVVYSLTAGVQVTFEEKTDVVDLTYETVASALLNAEVDITTHLNWVNDMGDPIIVNSMVVGGQSVLVDGDDGVITLHPVKFLFLRGDVSGNGDVWALLDALFLLEWFFLSGPQPPCMDAADADDNGNVQALVDATFLLAFAFLDGNSPPAPGTAECGEDPTDSDSLDCAEPLVDCL